MNISNTKITLFCLNVLIFSITKGESQLLGAGVGKILHGVGDLVKTVLNIPGKKTTTTVAPKKVPDNYYDYEYNYNTYDESYYSYENYRDNTYDNYDNEAYDNNEAYENNESYYSYEPKETPAPKPIFNIQVTPAPSFVIQVTPAPSFVFEATPAPSFVFQVTPAEQIVFHATPEPDVDAIVVDGVAYHPTSFADLTSLKYVIH